MQKNVLNYRIIIEPDHETGTNKPGFTAYCPTLGIADDGNSVDEALKNIKSLIQFHLECLHQEGEEIPEPDSDISLVTNLKVDFPLKFA